MSQTPLTKEYFDSLMNGLNETIDGFRDTMATKEDIRVVLDHFNKSQAIQNDRFDGFEARMRSSTQDIIRHFVQSQEHQNERLEVMDVKLDALLRETSTRKELHNLVDELHNQGVAVDSKKIFLID